MFNTDNVPEGALDVLLLPLMMVFFGLLVWVLAFNRTRLGERATWKWASMLPLAFGLFIGFTWIVKLRDPVYQLALVGGRIRAMHWVAFLVPLGSILAIIVIEVVMSRNRSQYGRRD